MNTILKFFGALFVALLGIAIIAITGIITGGITMLLWNFLFTGAGSIIGFALPTLTWFQGWCLVMFGSMVFRGSNSSSIKK